MLLAGGLGDSVNGEGDREGGTAEESAKDDCVARREDHNSEELGGLSEPIGGDVAEADALEGAGHVAAEGAPYPQLEGSGRMCECDESPVQGNAPPTSERRRATGKARKGKKRLAGCT